MFKSGIYKLIVLKINFTMSIYTNTLHSNPIPNVIPDENNDARDDVSVGASRPETYEPLPVRSVHSNTRIQIAAVEYIKNHCGTEPINFYSGSNRNCPLEPILLETKKMLRHRHRPDNSDGGSVSMLKTVGRRPNGNRVRNQNMTTEGGLCIKLPNIKNRGCGLNKIRHIFGQL